MNHSLYPFTFSRQNRYLDKTLVGFKTFTETFFALETLFNNYQLKKKEAIPFERQSKPRRITYTVQIMQYLEKQ